MCYSCQIGVLANKIRSAQPQTIAKVICDALSLIVSTCVFNQCHGYWLLLDVLATNIMLYVYLLKDRLDLQVEVDVAEDTYMCMKMKQLGANMQLQVAFVLGPLLDFMDFFKLFKAHNMYVLMLDPQFEDLSLVGDYVGHASVIEIDVAYDTNF
jgi:hypothetical protein